MKRVLLAGATGYLGSYIAQNLNQGPYALRVLARSPEKLTQMGIEVEDLFQAELTSRQAIEDCCNGIDTVISTVGITRQKDGLTYLDVDYQANLNLLNEAKEKFVEELEKSGLEYCVIRPNGFFSDMSEFYEMAQKGKIFLFGSGEQKTNPIHGEDLAKVCVDAIEGDDREIKVGGPETLTYNDIARLAFEVIGTKSKISRIPDWVRILTLKLVRVLTSSKFYGPIEFFLSVTAIDMVAPEYGKHRLVDYFEGLHRQKLSTLADL